MKISLVAQALCLPRVGLLPTQAGKRGVSLSNL